MGPVHLILGATGGIGSALCRLLAERGAGLALAARDGDRLNALAGDLGRGSTHVLDATDPEQVERVVGEALEQHGRLDGLVNCVGSIVLGPAHRTSPEVWRRTVALNLDTAFWTVRSGAAAMRKRGGSIVLVSSAAARHGLPNHEAVAAAKAGVIGLTLAAAATHARQGLRVNAVAPGLVRTPMARGLTDNPASERASIGMHPLGRLGEPEEVARAIAWLLDPEQGWVTGQVLGVDGGLGSLRPG